jgi:hypothetical protein
MADEAPDIPDQFRRFPREIVLQCENALRAARMIDEALADRERDVFFALHVFLVFAGIVSKLLWQQDKKPSRAKLRAALGVTDDSPLKRRTLRNYFEHFDNELATWGADPDANMIDRCVGPKSFFELPVLANHYFRLYDDTTHTAVFYDRDYPLQPIVAAIVELLDRARTLEAQLDAARWADGS